MVPVTLFFVHKRFCFRLHENVSFWELHIIVSFRGLTYSTCGISILFNKWNIWSEENQEECTESDIV